MQSRLQKDLLALLPLDDKGVEEENQLLFNAADRMADVVGELSPDEIDMVRRFSARIVYDYMQNIDVRHVFRSLFDGLTTSISEMGKKIEFTEINSKDFENVIGFGPTFRKLSTNPVIRPHLEYGLQLLWSDNHKEFLKLVGGLDKRYGKNRWMFKRFFLRVLLFPIFVIYRAKMKIKPFSSEQIAISLRILLYAIVSGETWAIAVKWLVSSPWQRRPDLQHIITIAGFNLQEGKDFNFVFDAISTLPWEQQYLLLGALGQHDNKAVDELTATLHSASPPVGMRCTNALILAAQRNPYAVQRFIDVVTNRDKYHEAVEEIILVQKYLMPVSKNALIAMLEEAYAISERNRDSYQRSRQSAARFLLNNVTGFEPSAAGYLLNVLQKSNDAREIIIALDALRKKMEQISNIDDQLTTSKNLVTSACALIQNTQVLFEKVGDIDLDAFDARVAAVKLALQAISFSPLELHQTLLLDIVNSLLTYDDGLAKYLQNDGIPYDQAKDLAHHVLLGNKSNYETILDKLENTLVRSLLEITQKTPDGIPVLIFQDLEKSDNLEWQKLYEIAEYLTRLFQSQIVAAGTLSAELSGYKTNVKWLQEKHGNTLGILTEAPPTLNSFQKANQYLQDVRVEIKQENKRRIERRRKKA